jgi:hypothetical protein
MPAIIEDPPCSFCARTISSNQKYHGAVISFKKILVTGASAALAILKTAAL